MSLLMISLPGHQLVVWHPPPPWMFQAKTLMIVLLIPPGAGIGGVIKMTEMKFCSVIWASAGKGKEFPFLHY